MSALTPEDKALVEKVATGPKAREFHRLMFDGSALAQNARQDSLDVYDLALMIAQATDDPDRDQMLRIVNASPHAATLRKIAAVAGSQERLKQFPGVDATVPPTIWAAWLYAECNRKEAAESRKPSFTVLDDG